MMLELFGVVVVSFLLSELYAFLPGLSDYILCLYVKALPEHLRDRYLEQWRGDIESLDGNLTKIYFTLDLVRAIPPLRIQEPEGLNEIAIVDPTVLSGPVGPQRFVAVPSSPPQKVLDATYRIDVVPPQSLESEGRRSIAAHIAINSSTTCMSEKLARLYGAEKEGDEITIVFRQDSYQTPGVEVFSEAIPLRVRFAHERLGDSALFIAASDLIPHLDCFEVVSQNVNVPDLIVMGNRLCIL